MCDLTLHLLYMEGFMVQSNDHWYSCIWKDLWYSPMTIGIAFKDVIFKHPTVKIECLCIVLCQVDLL